MKAGDEIEFEGKILVARPNLIQILTQTHSCEGCFFNEIDEPLACMAIDCGGAPEQSPADDQFILVLKEGTGNEADEVRR